MGQAFQDLQMGVGAINTALWAVGQEIVSALDQSGRYGAPGAQAQGAAQGAHQAAQSLRQGRLAPKTRLQQIAKDQKFALNDPTAGQTKTTSTEALMSLGGAQAWMAQQLGEKIAGGPLYQNIPAGTTTASGLASAGGGRGGGTGGSGGGQGTSPGGGGGQGAGGPGGTPAGGTTASSFQQSLGARIAASGGAAGGVMGALHDIPGVGLAVDAISKITGIYQQQREAGRAFQEVEGGTNLQGQVERLHQAAYQASMFGVMSPQNAALAFSGVTGLGLNPAAAGQAGQGQNRQSALNFIYGQYQQVGAPIQESLETLQTASQNTSINLDTLSSSLDKVSATAGQAGVNADSMRQVFQGILNDAIQNGAGAGSAALAGGLATTQASYGRAFAGANFAGETSQQTQYLLAGKYGITPGAVQYLMQTQPQTYAKMLAGSNTNIISQLGLGQELPQLQGMIKNYGGAGALNPAKVQQIATQWFGKNYNTMNTSMMASVINQQTGLNLNSNNVLPWIVNQEAGLNEASNTAANPAGGSVPARNTKGAPTGTGGLATGRAAGYYGVEGLLGRALPFGLGKGGAESWQQQLEADQKGGFAAKNYLSEEKQSGQRNPVLESLLQRVPAGTQVAVNTRSGMRVMEFGAAMKYYPNELASGNATFRGSTVSGSVSGITGGLADTGLSTAAEMQQRAGSNLGTPLAAYNAKTSGASQGGMGGTSVKVDLTNEAKQLLKLLPSNTSGAAAAGTVPTNPNAGSASR
jgi:hypothetical protein